MTNQNAVPDEAELVNISSQTAESVPELKVGHKVPVLCKVTGDWKIGEIVSIRENEGRKKYYIHYIDYNKRLDQWVDYEEIDVKNMNTTQIGDKRKEKDRSSATKKTPRKSSVASVISSSLLIEPETSAVESVPTTGSFRSSYERAHADVITRVKNIQWVQIGKFKITPWYFSPYPIELVSYECIYVCEWCLKPSKSVTCLNRHMQKCPRMHPPGNEIYRKENISVFEIDGRKNKDYVQNLCLLSKLFLDHKTVFYDTEPFLFYVLTEFDENGHHFVGYFSKEKESADDFNLACILTLPQHQRKGYGRFLIEFSYCLSLLENKKGHPEKPFSDLGLLSYRSYWSFAIMEVIMNRLDGANESAPYITINEICDATSIRREDVVATLHHLKLLHYYKGSFVICLMKEAVDNYFSQKVKRKLRVDIRLLHYKARDYSKY